MAKIVIKKRALDGNKLVQAAQHLEARGVSPAIREDVLSEILHMLLDTDISGTWEDIYADFLEYA